jgi:DNA-binding transcriptional LysR family regulator
MQNSSGQFPYLDSAADEDKHALSRIFFGNPLKINRLDDLQVFVAAAEAGSFTDVARHLHLTPAAVSAVVKRLEQALGTRLFERSTRHVRLSEAGERLLAPARQALQALAQCEGALQDANDPAGRLAGPLRMALPSDLGRHQLLGWLAEFLADDEAVSLELRVSDRLSHLLEQPVDLAVRYGEPDDSGFIALPLAPRNARVLVASPAYLARHGAPQTPAELRRHNCLRFVLGESLYSRWRLEARPRPRRWRCAGATRPTTARWCASGRCRAWALPTRARWTWPTTWPPAVWCACCRAGASPHR